ncbi:hypothetical protein HDU93_004213, partial [Gonapodya sp. JEL0774]
MAENLATKVGKRVQLEEEIKKVQNQKSSLKGEKATKAGESMVLTPGVTHMEDWPGLYEGVATVAIDDVEITVLLSKNRMEERNLRPSSLNLCLHDPIQSKLRSDTTAILLEKHNIALAKLISEITALLPSPQFSELPIGVLAQLATGNLNDTRQKFAAVDKKRSDLRDKEEVCDNLIADAVKKSYKQLSLKLHPDRLPHSTDADKAKFQELKEAHTVLWEIERRKEYVRIYDHNEYLRLRRPKTGGEMAADADIREVLKGKGKGGPRTRESGGGALRIRGGIPHQCSIPRISNQTLVNKRDGTIRIAVLWICSDSDYLGVTRYEVELSGT